MASTDVPVQQRQMAVSENNLRPHLIQFNRCRNVLLDGFKIRQSPFGLFISIYVMGGLPVILMFMHMDIIMME